MISSKGNLEYTVYPLEGIWDLTKEEIYISDARKTKKDKMKTVLRYMVYKII